MCLSKFKAWRQEDVSVGSHLTTPCCVLMLPLYLWRLNSLMCEMGPVPARVVARIYEI